MPSSRNLHEVFESHLTDGEFLTVNGDEINRLSSARLLEKLKTEVRAGYVQELDDLRNFTNDFIENFSPAPVSPSSFSIPFSKIPRSAAMIMVAGQSNSVNGNEIPLDTNFPNVFTLDYDNVAANPYDSDQWETVPFTSQMTYSVKQNFKNNSRWTVAYAFARKWQDLKNSGHNLPNLYLYHAGYNGQAFVTGWNPGANSATAGENLWRYLNKVHKFARRKLLNENRVVRDLGLIWAQFEGDLDRYNKLYYNYLSNFLGGFDGAGEKIPFCYFFPRSTCIEVPTKIETGKSIVAAFEKVERERPGVLRIDVKNLPGYDDDAFNNGLIFRDKYHYNYDLYDTFLGPIFQDMLTGSETAIQAAPMNNGIIVSE